MLNQADVLATIAVSDLQRALPFYRDILGLKHQENPGAFVFESGKSKLVVYQSEYAGTNKATSATWEVPDAGKVVDDLRAKGVTFEHYDNLPGLTRKGDLHVMGTFKGAWLKDPDGNILHIMSR